MATFLETQTDLLNFVSRPISDAETLIRVKAAINNAIRTLQRERSYTFLEDRETLTFAANDVLVAGTELTRDSFREIISAEITSNASASYGFHIPVVSARSLMSARRNFQLNGPIPGDTDEWTYVVENLGFQNFVQAVHKRMLYVQGSSLGLYPLQNVDVYLNLTYVAWVNDLSEDADTNDFLTFGYDVVFQMAGIELCNYLGLSQRAGLLSSQLELSLPSLHKFSTDRNTYSS